MLQSFHAISYLIRTKFSCKLEYPFYKTLFRFYIVWRVVSSVLLRFVENSWNSKFASHCNQILSSTIVFVALLCNSRSLHLNFILKKPIEGRGNIFDLKPIEVYICQFTSKWGFNGLRFDPTISIPIKTIETIENPKSLKHKSYENQSLDLFIFFDIFLNYIHEEITFNWHYAKDI